MKSLQHLVAKIYGLENRGLLKNSVPEINIMTQGVPINMGIE